MSTGQDILPLIAGMRTMPKKEKRAAKKEPEQIAMQPAGPARQLDALEQRIYDQLLAGDLDFDALSEKTGIAGDELGSLLMMLELDGIVVSLPGPAYRLA